MSRFKEPFDLKDTGNTKAEFRQYIEGMRPTIDLVDDDVMSVVNDKISILSVVPRIVRFTFNFNAFTKAATTSDDKTIMNIGRGGVLLGTKVVLRERFEDTNGAMAQANLAVGLTPGSPNEFVSAADLSLSPGRVGSHVTGDSDRWLVEDDVTPIFCKLDAGAQFTNVLVKGVVDVWLHFAQASSEL